MCSHGGCIWCDRGESFVSGSMLTVKFTADTNTPFVLRPSDLHGVVSLSPPILHRLPHFAVWLNAKTFTIVFPVVEESEWIDTEHGRELS